VYYYRVRWRFIRLEGMPLLSNSSESDPERLKQTPKAETESSPKGLRDKEAELNPERLKQTPKAEATPTDSAESLLKKRA
jgi:hypothetical protein